MICSIINSLLLSTVCYPEGSSNEDLSAVVYQIGGFPLLGDPGPWPTDGGFIDLMARLSELGLNYGGLFELAVRKRSDDKSKICLSVSQRANCHQLEYCLKFSLDTRWSKLE